jgi:hypothetical protein
MSRFFTRITLHYLPLLQNPPIHLAIVLARDSEGTFESPPDRPNGLEEGVKKFRMASYLWQAYIAEAMFRNFPGSLGNGGSARRSFRVEEEWTDDTLSLQENHVRRLTAKVHVVRSPFSVEGGSESPLLIRNATANFWARGEGVEDDCKRGARYVWRTFQRGGRVFGTRPDCVVSSLGLSLVCIFCNKLKSGENSCPQEKQRQIINYDLACSSVEPYGAGLRVSKKSFPPYNTPLFSNIRCKTTLKSPQHHLVSVKAAPRTTEVPSKPVAQVSAACSAN